MYFYSGRKITIISKFTSPLLFVISGLPKSLSRTRHRSSQPVGRGEPSGFYSTHLTRPAEALSPAKMTNRLDHLLTVLLHEYSHRVADSYELVLNGIMKAILGILARNLVREQTSGCPKPKSPSSSGISLFTFAGIFYGPNAYASSS
jgi:hypothetical protein